MTIHATIARDHTLIVHLTGGETARRRGGGCWLAPYLIFTSSMVWLPFTGRPIFVEGSVSLSVTNIRYGHSGYAQVFTIVSFMAICSLNWTVLTIVSSMSTTTGDHGSG